MKLDLNANFILICPQLYMAPVELTDGYITRINFWNDVFGIDSEYYKNRIRFFDKF